MARRAHFVVFAGLSGALVAIATLIQMYVDWNQSSAMGLQAISWKLRLATLAAAVLTLTALVLGVLPALRSPRR